MRDRIDRQMDQLPTPKIMYVMARVLKRQQLERIKDYAMCSDVTAY